MFIEILLSTYNGEAYLCQQLDSILAQTHRDFHLTIRDDGSTDGTREILAEYSAHHPDRITLMPADGNRGYPDCFWYLLANAEEADLYAFCDQDDIWKADKLEKLEKEIGNRALVFGDAEVIDKDGNVIRDSWRKEALIQKSIPFKAQIAGINNVTGCLSLFKAELLDMILPIPEGVTVHDRWVAMIAERNGGIKAIDDAVVQYRLHDSNAVGGKPAPAMSKTLEIQQRWLRMILENCERLSLTADEILFTKHLLALSQKRMNRYFMPFEIPWVFAIRKVLFEKVPALALTKKILFTVIGLPLAKKIWKKS